MSMVIRLNGWAGYLSRQKGLGEKYRLLMRSEHAPGWPIIVSSICLPLGIAVVFGAILLSR